MTRIFSNLTALIFAFLLLASGKIQAPTPDTFVSAPSEAAIGEQQTWYVSFSFPEGQAVSDLSIENGLPEAWSFPSVSVNAPARNELVNIQVVSLKAGSFQPRLLIAYKSGQDQINKVILGETVTIQSVENSVKLQIISPGETVKTDQEVQLATTLENRSPFHIEAVLNVDFPGTTPPVVSQSITLDAGKQASLNFPIKIQRSGTPIVKASIQWTDSQKVVHSSFVQTSGSQIEIEPDPGISNNSAMLEGLLAGVFTGLLAIGGALISFRLNNNKEATEKRKKDINFTEGLLLMVELNTQQALTNRKPVDMKFLGDLLLDNNLYQVLHERNLDDVTRKLWIAADMYNNKFETQQFSEFNNRLSFAFNDFMKFRKDTITKES